MLPPSRDLATSTAPVTVLGHAGGGSNATSAWTDGLPEVHLADALVGGFLSLFVAVTIFGNCLVILAVVRDHCLRTITNYFIVSLATADLLMGLVVMPFSVVSYVTRDHWLFGPVWCDLWHAFDVLSTTASILNLCMIAVERFWAIENPISYPSRVTKRRCLLLVSAVWICSCCISFPAILWWRMVSPPAKRNECSFTDDPAYLICSSLVSFYTPLLVMVFVYCKIYRTATQLVKSWEAGAKVLHGIAGANGEHSATVVLRIHRGRQEVTPAAAAAAAAVDGVDGDSDEAGAGALPSAGGLARRFRSLGVRKKLARFSREQRAAKTLGVVMGIFIACWMPFFVCNIVLAIKRDALGSHEPKVMMIVTWLGYINSSVNPGIYAHSMRDFRRAFLKLLGCRRGGSSAMLPPPQRRPKPAASGTTRTAAASSPNPTTLTPPQSQRRRHHWLLRRLVRSRRRSAVPIPTASAFSSAAFFDDFEAAAAASALRSPLRARWSRSGSRLSSYRVGPPPPPPPLIPPPLLPHLEVLSPPPSPPSPIYACNPAFFPSNR